LLLALVPLMSSSLLKAAKEAHWAVLVAGSDGWWNYRHQTDVCHAYKMLLENGMKAERIIVLAKDDIANNGQNPFKGQLFNKPDPSGKGVDVYAGCKIDFKGNDVTPSVFMSVIKGEKDAVKGKGTGRVLESNENDKVFIFYSDHGATGLIAFPVGGYLYVDTLIAGLKSMHEKKQYKRLVFYLEACESGSMFEDVLPNDWEIYATTAANAVESSWATYCSPNDVINGKHVGACLGDEYSCNFMEDTDGAEDGKHLQKQFEDVRDRTKGSHGQQYGILDWTVEEALTNFQGDVDTSLTKKFKKLAKRGKNALYYLIHGSFPESDYKAYLSEAKKSIVDARDTKLRYLQEKNERLGSEETKSELEQEVAHRAAADDFFSKLNSSFGYEQAKMNLTFIDCYRNSINLINEKCPGLMSEYSLKYGKNLYSACVNHGEEELERFITKNC